jgi:ABC-type multidrug transport system permease subunit
LFSFGVLTFISVLCLAALGIVLAVAIKRTDGITTLITMASAFSGGVFFPITVLPAQLQWVACALPFSRSLSGIRRESRAVS